MLYLPITLNVFNNIITSIKEMFLHLADEFKFVFINGNRYKQMITGFQNTLKITFGALIIGIVIGIIVAAVRSTYDKNADKMRKKRRYWVYTAFNT